MTKLRYLCVPFKKVAAITAIINRQTEFIPRSPKIYLWLWPSGVLF